MDKEAFSSDLNSVIGSVNNVDQELLAIMVINNIPTFETVMFNSQYNLQAYQEIDEAFNFAVEVVNTLVNVSWKLGVVDTMTGEIVRKIKPFIMGDIQEKTVELLMSDKLLELQNKFDEVDELLITYGYIKERK